MPTTDPSTLTEVLLYAAKRFPEKGIGIFDGRGRSVQRRTYADLVAGAQQAAGQLKGLGLRPGDRALICLPTSWAWMDAWMGALLLGALPVAIAPPGAMGSSAGHTHRVANLRRHLDGRVIAPEALRRSALELEERDLVSNLWTPAEIAAQAAGDGFRSVPRDPEDIAFLQLTSGSTGMPRAVQITHRAAVHNGDVSNEAIGSPHGAPAHTWANSMVSWLPLHHDMGLVGCLFLSIRQGLDLWLLNPATFLARPHLWLKALGSRGVTFAPAPNFGYQLCVERIRASQLEGLDLSGWRAAMTGAEMVRPETIAAFSELAAPAGFRPETFRPCYGLAEATLAVTFDQAGTGIRTLPLPEGVDSGLGLNEVVCLGKAVRDTEVLIAAPDDSALGEGEIGEVRVQGPGVFAGYWNDPEATAAGLRGGWLCTGDLGFLHQGELYLTGRTKDLLILRGHNVMPHELEWLAESVTGGGGAQRSGAFSIARGPEGEEAILVLETGERDPENLKVLARDVRLRVGRALNLPVADIAFVRRGKLPKTTSGKVQRQQLRQAYLDGSLERLNVS